MWPVPRNHPIFPASVRARLIASKLEWEGFVAKLNSDLSSILAATFLGGRSIDMPFALALDPAGNVYVAGDTGSVDFPGVGLSSADSTLRGG